MKRIKPIAITLLIVLAIFAASVTFAVTTALSGHALAQEADTAAARPFILAMLKGDAGASQALLSDSAKGDSAKGQLADTARLLKQRYGPAATVEGPVSATTLMRSGIANLEYTVTYPGGSLEADISAVKEQGTWRIARYSFAP